MGKDYKKFIITKDQKLFKFTFTNIELGFYYYSDETKEKLSYDEIKNRILLETDDVELVIQFCANMANKNKS